MREEKNKIEIQIECCIGGELSEEDINSIAQLIAKWIFQDPSTKEIENVSDDRSDPTRADNSCVYYD